MPWVRGGERMGRQGLASRIVTLVEDLARPIVEAMGLELVEVEWVREGGRRFLRLYIDREGGVTLDDCEAVSRSVEAELDRLDPIPGSYYLEVSSPGLERPLKRDADFVRFAGRKVRVITYAPVEGRKEFVGELLGLVEGQVRLRLPASRQEPEREVAIPRDQVAKAHLYVEF